MKENKILIIGPIPPPSNGMSITTENILNNSGKFKDFKLIHFDISDRRGLSNVGKLEFRNIWLAILHFLKFIKVIFKLKPEIIYLPIAQNTMGFLRDCLFLYPSILFRKKIIIHLHGSYFREFYKNSNFLLRTIIRFPIKRAACAIVLNTKFKEIFKEFLPDNKIKVVENGVQDILNSTQNLKIEKEISYNKNRNYVLFFGTLMKNKGFFDLVEAIPKVVKNNDNTRFLFAGELCFENEEVETKIFIKKESLKEYVYFLNQREGIDKTWLFNNADIFVFPPNWSEGQPLVILEALSASLPVISTGLGAIPEMVIDGYNGFIVDKETPEQIADKIKYLVDHPDKILEMGKRSREIYLKKYTIDKFISNLSKVFECV